jgi:hypothetical protein
MSTASPTARITIRAIPKTVSIASTIARHASLRIVAISLIEGVERPPAGSNPGANAKTIDALARISQCAQTARITSGGRFHPESCRFGLVAGKRRGWVTGRAEALRQRPPLGG